MTKAELRTELAGVKDQLLNILIDELHSNKSIKDDKFWQAVRHLWLDMENKDYFA